MNTYSFARAVNFAKSAFIFSVTAGFALCFSSIATAQETPSVGLTPPPSTSSTDAAGVDIMSGSKRFSLKDLSIGTGVSSLSHEITADRTFFYGFLDNFNMQVHPYANIEHRMQVIVGESSQDFNTVSDGTPWRMPTTPVNNNGATLEKKPGTTAYRYTKNDGTVVSFGYDAVGLSTITYPNGFQITKKGASVTTNTGLQFKYLNSSRYPNEIIAINNAYEYCSPTATSCALSLEWPSVIYEWPTEAERNNQAGNFSVITADGVKTTYRHKKYHVSGIFSEPLIETVAAGTSLSPASITASYEYGHVTIPATGGGVTIVIPNAVIKATEDGAVWNYSYPTPPALYALKEGASSGPMGTQHIFLSNTGAPHSYIINTDMPDGTHADFNLPPINQPHTVTSKGKKFTYAYDKRGNLIKVTQHAAVGSPEAGSIKEMEAYYPNPDSITCTNLKTCNQPTWVRDAKGNQTDYTYYEEHGGVKTVTLPAASSGGARATTWYKYAQKYAWYKKNGNTLERADTPVWLLTEELSCTVGAANAENDTCLDPSAKLVITRYDYGADGVPNNLWMRGVEVIADGKTLRTCYQYDYYGNVIAETQPKAGLSSCQ